MLHHAHGWKISAAIIFAMVWIHVGLVLGEEIQPPEHRRAPAPTAARPPDRVSLHFNRADLVEVIHVLAQHLKLTYAIDPEVKGTATIDSAEPLKKEDLWPVFHQVLRMNGAVAIKTGALYRIAPI